VGKRRVVQGYVDADYARDLDQIYDGVCVHSG